MQTTIKTQVLKTVDLKFLRVDAGVQYWEDATINGVADEQGDLTPCRNGYSWQPIIDIETGIITNWKQGVKASIHFKVSDSGSYYLQDADGVEHLSIENDYVPAILSPKENGYGDYIIMDIDEKGKIDGWKFDIEEFSGNEEE